MVRKARMLVATRTTVILAAFLIAAARGTPMTAHASEAQTMNCCAASDGPQTVTVNPPPSHPVAAEYPAAPTSRPQGTSIRGSVKISGRLDLQKPDLTRIIVFLASNPALDQEPSSIDHVTVAQKNKSFVPNFAVVQRGTTVEFPNWDDFDHNVFSRSKAAPAFDLDRYPRGQSKSRVFEKVGVVQVFCNIHPQMRAIIYVTPNRCFARADAEGHFELTDVPPGQYEIVAWQERCGEQRQSIEVKPGASPDVSLTLEENRQTIIANDPPRRDSGYGVERGLGVKREKLNLPVVKDAHPATDGPPD